jgi:hypothetical protein
VFPSLKARGRVPLSASIFVADHLRAAAKKVGVHIEDRPRFGLHNLRHAKIQTTLYLYSLNLLSLATYRLHWNPEHVARYGFLFAIPWAWILDGLFVSIHSRWLSALYGYAVLLWVPALLYSGCLWLLVVGIPKLRRASLNQ